MRELGKRDVVKNVARSMLAAGLVHGITDLVSSADIVADTAGQATQATASTLTAEMASKTFGDYAQAAVIQSAVNTALSVAMDGQDFGKALK